MSHNQKIYTSRFLIILWGVVAISFVLRMWGIQFGLPYEYHVDEVQYVRQAASMGEKGLEPALWNNPPLFKYMLLAEYGMVYLVGKILGLFSSPSSFGSSNSFDPTLLYLLARGSSALFGSMTVFLLGLVGRNVFNLRVGLMSAWFLAVSFLHVRDSHFAVNDILATFFMLLTLFAALNILVKNELKWYVLAGISVGLGFATKYTALFSLIPVLLSHFLNKDNSLLRFSRLSVTRLLLCAFVSIGSAVLASPYFIITPKKVFDGIYEFLFIPGKTGFNGWEIDPAGGYVFYLKSLLWGLGYGLLILVCVGLFVGIFSHSKKALVILSFPIAMYFFMGRQHMYFSRFIIPLIPPLLLWSAHVLDDQLRNWPSNKLLLNAIPILILFLTVQPFADSIKLDILLSRTDTRTLAKEWIENNIPDGSKVAFDWAAYSPALSSPSKRYPNSKKTYHVTVLEGSGLFEKPVDWYREQGFDYIVTSSFISSIPLSDQEENLHRKLFYETLENEFKLIKVFSPGKDNEPIDFVFDEIYGPFISLWQREHPGPILRLYYLGE